MWATRLALRKERRQLLWSKLLDRFFALEEQAGQLVEELSSYRSLDQTKVASSLEEFRQTAGRFARYDSVRRAILDLQNNLERMFVTKRDREDDERLLRSELDVNLKKLLKACDEITKRDKLLTGG
jgi:hypothetical protein